jgi:hypothetical protein
MLTCLIKTVTTIKLNQTLTILMFMFKDCKDIPYTYTYDSLLSIFVYIILLLA